MNDYSKVIDILMSGELDYKKVVIELAKKYPSTFLEIITSIHLAEPWMIDIIHNIRNGDLIMAIKILRQEVKFPLKNAKEVCEKLAFAIYKRYGFETHEKGLKRMFPSINYQTSGSIIHLDDEYLKMYNRLVEMIDA